VKALFLGNVAADTAEGIRSELPPELKLEIIANPKDLPQSPEAAAEADILVTNIWRADYPPAPQVRLVQSVATGIEWIEQAALPRGVAVCNAYGHETAIAEYVLMTMLVWSHRFREIEGDFRLRSSWAPSWVHSGAPHGEIRGSTLGIVGLGPERRPVLGNRFRNPAGPFQGIAEVVAGDDIAGTPGDRVGPQSEFRPIIGIARAGGADQIRLQNRAGRSYNIGG